MSIFDRNRPFDPSEWLQEKTLAALEETARLVDLANEPDTTPWYAKTLRERAGRLASRLAPIVALLHDAGQEAASHEEWGLLLHGGSFGLARWCKKHGIADPHKIAMKAAGAIVADDPDDLEDREAKAEEIVAPPASAEDARGLNLKLQIYGCHTRDLLHGDVSPAEQRLALWLLSELWLSPYADIVIVSRRFLPTDINVTPQETAEAYRSLYERGKIERVELPDRDLRPEALPLRLVVSGANDSKHPRAYQEETFGFPGARIGGQPTSGNLTLHALAPTEAQLVTGLSTSRLSRALDELRVQIQEHLGDERVYIEKVELDSTRGSLGLRVHFRQRLDEDDDDNEMLRAGITAVIETWVKSLAPRN